MSDMYKGFTDENADQRVDSPDTYFAPCPFTTQQQGDEMTHQ